MKTRILSGLLVVFLSFAFINANADEDFKKNFSKEFQCDENTLVDIKNKFGDVNITDWDKDMVSIQVVITVEADDQEEANEYFDRIKITLDKDGNTVKGHTELVESFNNVDFRIDYEVNMPKNLKLLLENKYGDVTINELANHVDIAVKYGSLRANKLSYGDDKPRSQVYLGYSKSSKIGECGWLKVQMAYSTLEIEKSDAIMILSKYSTFYAEESNSIVAESKYDGYKIGRLKKFVTTEAKYSKYHFRELTQKIESLMKYSDIEVEKIPAGFDEIDIEMKYGKVKLGIEAGASYEVEAECEYGAIKYPESKNLSTHKGNTSQKIWGVIGDESNPKSKVNVECKYGKIYLE